MIRQGTRIESALGSRDRSPIIGLGGSLGGVPARGRRARGTEQQEDGASTERGVSLGAFLPGILAAGGLRHLGLRRGGHGRGHGVLRAVAVRRAAGAAEAADGDGY